MPRSILEGRIVKNEATILQIEMSHFNILHDWYHLQFQEWWEVLQNGSSLDDHVHEVNIEIDVIWLLTCTMIECQR